MDRDKQKKTEGAGFDPKMGEINREGSNFGEVDPGVGGDVTEPAGREEHTNPDTDTTGTYFEPNAGRDLGLQDIDRGQPTGEGSTRNNPPRSEG